MIVIHIILLYLLPVWLKDILVGESTEGGSNQFLYQHARNFDWGMTSAVGIENRRWTVKLQYEISLGKESKNDNIGVNYNSLTLSVGYKLNVK